MKPLSNRERQIVALVTEGLGDRDIGFRLGITRNTVRTFMVRIFHKAGVNSRVELAVMFARGLFPERSTTDARRPDARGGTPAPRPESEPFKARRGGVCVLAC